MKKPGEIIAAARAEIRALCLGKGRGGRRWTMCVPVHLTDSDVVLAEAIDLAEKQVLVHGRDVEFWAESYTMVRDAIASNLEEFIHDDDVAEEAILIDAVIEAAHEIARLRLQLTTALKEK